MSVDLRQSDMRPGAAGGESQTVDSFLQMADIFTAE